MTGQVAAILTVLAVGPACAQLYTEDFETNPAVSWTIHESYTDPNPFPFNYPYGIADHHFDYSTIGIPPAPGGPGNHGLKLQANLFHGVFGGMSTSPTALSLTGDYTVRFDWWANFNGPFPGGGSGSTNLSTFGIGSDNAGPQHPGSPRGIMFAATGDGGSGADWRAYDNFRPNSYNDPSDIWVHPVNSRDSAHPYYAGIGGVSAPAAQRSMFPQQSGITATGSGGMAWHTVVITKEGDGVVWTVDGLHIATLSFARANVRGGHLSFGHSDVNDASSFDANAGHLLFTLIDNIRVDGPPCPADIDGSGSLNVDDIAAFVAAFLAQDVQADLTGEGAVNIDDIEAFVEFFLGGCD